jgi:hypothetical protein
MFVTAHTRSAVADAPNEDWYIATDDLVIVLDGATIRTETGCVHGLPWYVRSLGGQLLGAAIDHSIPLAECIATAIETVNAMHSDTCDLNHPGTPSAAVGMVRRRAEKMLEYAVLGDITVAFEVAGQPHAHVVVDPRVSQVAVAERRECDRHLIGTDAKMAAILAMKDLELAGRNTTNGYWIASVDPSAAKHALTGNLLVDQVPRFAVCSDGAMRVLEMTSLNSHDGVLNVLRHIGPTALVDMVRRAEHNDPQGARWPRNKATDDATAVFVELQEPPRQAPLTVEQQQAALELIPMTTRPVMGEFAHR